MRTSGHFCSSRLRSRIGQMMDEDLRSVFAYLKSIPAIRNDVPEHKVPAEVIEQISIATKKAMQAAAAQR
jgi:hypothetical protein